MSSLKYYFTRVSLQGHTEKFRAVPILQGTFSERQMVAAIALRNTGLPVQVISSIVNTLFSIRDERLAEGYIVHLGDTIYRPTIGGSYPTDKELVNSARVAVYMTNSEKPVDGMQFEKVEERVDTSFAFIKSVYDVATEATNGQVTPVDMVELSGRRLSFDAADPELGVFFVDAATGDTFRAVRYGMNRPSILIFNTPALVSGQEYVLQVRTRPNPEDEVKVTSTKFTLEAQ